MATSIRLGTQSERRFDYPFGSRADRIFIESSSEPEPDPRIEPSRTPAAGPKTATNASTRASLRAPSRTKAGAPAKTEAAATKGATRKVIKKKAKPKKQLLPAKTECSICADTKNTAACFKLIAETHICQHWKTICKLCISNMVKYKVSKRQLGQVELECPFPGCDLALSLPMVKLNMTKTAYEEYDKALTKNFLSKDASYMTCLSSDCGKYFCVADCDGNGKSKKDAKLMIECPYCNQQICLTCMRPWESHGSNSCAKVREQEEKASAEALKSLGVKLCPACNVNIQKTGGCDHMFCRHCNHNFCWVCLVPYSSNVQHASHCEHYRIDAAADPRNWAHTDLEIEQVNRLVERNMVYLDNLGAEQALLPQVRPAPVQQLSLPAFRGPPAPLADILDEAREWQAHEEMVRPGPNQLEAVLDEGLGGILVPFGDAQRWRLAPPANPRRPLMQPPGPRPAAAVHLPSAFPSRPQTPAAIQQEREVNLRRANVQDRTRPGDWPIVPLWFLPRSIYN